MRKSFLNMALLLAATVLTTGCAVNRATATIDPSANLPSIKSIYVAKFAPDERGVNVVIANKLKAMRDTHCHTFLPQWPRSPADWSSNTAVR